MKGAHLLAEPPPPAGPIEYENLFGTPEDYAQSLIELGTIGWQGDEEIIDAGDPTTDSGVSYVKVTLHAGSPADEPTTDDGAANGYRIRCRALGGVRVVPTYGQSCVVLFPGGHVAEGRGICLPLEGNASTSTAQLPRDGTAGGATTLYGGKGNFVKLHAGGAVSLMTTDTGTTDGKTIALMLLPRNDADPLSGGLEFHSPWGRLTFGPSGFFVEHSSGASLMLGPIAGIPAPLGALSSQAQLTADSVDVAASALTLGTDSGAANLAALTQLQTTLTAIETALLTISTTPAAVGNPVLTPAQAALVTAANAALAPLITNIGKPV